MKTRVKILVGGVVLLIIAVVYVYFFLWNKPHTDYDKATADYTITAEELYAAFTENDSLASVRYNGKVIEISGTLKLIEDQDTVVTAVFSFGQGMFGEQGIRCTMLPKYFDAARKLKEGSPVKLKGVCQGYIDEADVILESVSIVE